MFQFSHFKPKPYEDVNTHGLTHRTHLMPRTHNQVSFTSLCDAFSTYIDPHSTSVLHHERTAPVPCPGQPNRSTRFLYRPNIVAGCVVVRCGRPKPVSITILQHRLKSTVYRTVRPCLTAHPIGRNALNKWRELPETGSPAAQTSKYSTQLRTSFAAYTPQRDHGPICAERARGERRKYQGLGKLRLCLVWSTLQTTWNSYQRKQTRIANFIASRARKITNGLHKNRYIDFKTQYSVTQTLIESEVILYFSRASN